MGEKWQDAAAVFRYDRNELCRWLRQTEKEKRKYNIALLILALMAFNFLVVVPTAEKKLPSILMAALCVVLFVFVLLVSRSQKGGLRVDALYREGAEYHVFVYEDRIVQHVDGAQDTISLDDVKRIEEHDSYFAFRYGQDGLLLLPKSAMSEEQSTALGHELAQALGRRYRLCGR